MDGFGYLNALHLQITTTPVPSRFFHNVPSSSLSVGAHLLSSLSYIHSDSTFIFHSSATKPPPLSSLSMASSDSDAAEISSLFERLFRTRDVSMFLPFLFGLSESRNSDDPDQETESDEGFQRQRIILVNPFTQGMVVIDGASSLEALFRELGSAANKGGQPPASKESIDAMPSVEVGEGDDDDGECVVCLEGFEVGKVVKEMPCKHRFHPDCIEKWLGIHGSCPVCRYEMPVEEKDVGKKGDEEGEEGGEERRSVGGEVWVSFSFNGSSRNQEPNQAPSHDDDSSDSSSSPRGDAEVEES